MAFKKSPSSVRSAPKAKGRLAAFSAQVEALAGGGMSTADAASTALVLALNKRNVIRSSELWNIFTQQVASTTEQKLPPFRVLPPSQDLPPLP